MEDNKIINIRRQTKIKMAKNLIFFIALIFFTFWFVFRKQDLKVLLHIFKKVNFIYVLIALFVMFCVHLIESINIKKILMSLGENKISLLRAFKYTGIGAFFSAITPASSGGQPIEIYYMSKDHIKVANGTVALLIELCGFHISTLSLSLICVSLNSYLLNDGLIWFYIVGLILNGSVLVLMLLSTFSQNVARNLLGSVIKMLTSIKVKNIDDKKKKIEKLLEQYIESTQYIKTHKLEFTKAILRAFAQVFLFHSIPFFIYKSFGLNELSFFQIFSIQAVLYTTVSSIPLPGSIGISETLFFRFYKYAFNIHIIGNAMILCRFCSFYFYVIVFAIIVIINSIKNKNIEGEIDYKIEEIEKDYSKQ